MNPEDRPVEMSPAVSQILTDPTILMLYTDWRFGRELFGSKAWHRPVAVRSVAPSHSSRLGVPTLRPGDRELLAMGRDRTAGLRTGK